MKLRDRYPQLQDPAVVKAMVLRSVYASMALENQTVSLARLAALYEQTGPMPPTGAAARETTPGAGPARSRFPRR
jgi:hypothetical protein